MSRPQNMFDITEMTYEQYCDKHYAVLIERMQSQIIMQQQHFAQTAGRGSMGRGYHGGYRGAGRGRGGAAGYSSNRTTSY